MIKALKAIFEICTFVIPIFVAMIFLLRTTEAYDERYDSSKLKFFGMNKRQYRLFFRLLGALCLIVGIFAVYKNYFEEPVSEYQETIDFWKDVDKSNDPLRAAMLLGAAIAIPARMGSSRFPGKPLALLGGKAVLQRVYENCLKCELAEKVVILTDSPEILEFADTINAPAIETSSKCASGTERIIEAFGEIDADFVVNVQGDEPFISPKLVDSIIAARRDRNAELVTAVSKITDAQTLLNPNVVKVLRDNSGASAYFSRSPLPYVRGEPNAGEWLKRCDYWRHIGVYGYSAKSIARYASLPASKMEKCEMLEQLRFIAAGYKFDIVETDYVSIGIDTPDDLAAAEEFLKKSV
ncbi:MAG: 3-deoxy-manno-octulosonate cytidylyltransferase [Opitutales bacterium]|nr:3-deoxy-manno-octulosonate cytidylyltransferase [Opitutales bacterium]